MVDFRGHQTYSDGKVYFTSTMRYGEHLLVVDVVTGKIELSVRLLEPLEKWLTKHSPKAVEVGNLTAPAIVGERLFCGDNFGRLWALDRRTGEPVWHHRPKGAAGYLAHAPVVDGNRLYANTFSMDPKRPSTLYCYEIA
jgi:outer membrane protein assembly factor BamB